MLIAEDTSILIRPVAVRRVRPSGRLFEEPRCDLYLGVDAEGELVDLNGHRAPHYPNARVEDALALVACLYEVAAAEAALGRRAIR